MSAIEMLRTRLEKTGWKVLSLQECSRKYRNIHTGKDTEVVFEYKIEDGVGFSAHVYVLSDGDTWQIGQFNDHFMAV